ncbi:MAG: hypothetical protein IJE05_01805 [Clostridia bacterium]|nr:hypothetical protein [Clostridia bacterium]
MKDKVKLYDKEINKKAEGIKALVMMLVIFIIGFITGSYAVNMELQKANDEKQEHIVELEKLLEEKQVKINEQFIEIDALKETVYMLEVYGK